MTGFFDPTPDEVATLEGLAAETPGIQRTMVDNHAKLTQVDRGAHQQQIAGSRVALTVADRLPPALDGLGLFRPGSSAIGIGRMSTGLGCPHAETDPDFLGLMVAFRTATGRRIDFVTINDPTSPTDTPEEFIALLKATADAAASENLFASQTRLLLSLGRHAGVRAPAIALHITGQTLRTVRSSSAYQQYWTGVVRARDVLGKFTFIPAEPVPQSHGLSRSARHLTEDWRRRQSTAALTFRLFWIPFLSERDTPLENLTATWRADHQVEVGSVSFPRVDPSGVQAKLTALLASELGANPGNWQEVSEGAEPPLPATRFTAARALVYREGQRQRGALSEAAYESFFDRGEVSQELALELIRRYGEKRAAGHWVPDVGEIAPT
jgi:hypothetical protein